MAKQGKEAGGHAAEANRQRITDNYIEEDTHAAIQIDRIYGQMKISEERTPQRGRTGR